RGFLSSVSHTVVLTGARPMEGQCIAQGNAGYFCSHPLVSVKRAFLFTQAKASNSAGTGTTNGSILQNRTTSTSLADCGDNRFVRFGGEAFARGIDATQFCGRPSRSWWPWLASIPFRAGRSRRPLLASYAWRARGSLQPRLSLSTGGPSRTSWPL